MRMIRVMLLLVAVQAAVCRAAPPECVFEHYSSLDGLPHNSISDIYKDRKGFIWICTWYGISRFDGYTFKNYQTLPGDYSPLSHNRFLKVTGDAAGDLWITTYDNRLYRFDRTRETFLDVPGSFDGFRDGKCKVDVFHCSQAGYTWIGVAGRGLVRTSRLDEHGSPLEIVSYTGNRNVGKRIGMLYENRAGKMFVVSEVGITLFTPRDGDFSSTLLSGESNIAQIKETGGRVYCSAGQHILVFDGNGNPGPRIEIPGGDVATALETSPDGRALYIGTGRSGMLRYDTATGQLHREGPPPGHIRFIVADSHGTLWVTTRQPGIFRYNPSLGGYKHFEQKMNAVSYYVDSLTRVVEAGDRVWIKLNMVGFGYYDRATDRLEPFYNQPGERFTNGMPCYEIDSTGILWMSTSARGLEKVTIIDQKASVFTPATRQDDRAGSEIRALLHDSHGRLWIAAKSGELLCYDSSWKLLHKFPDARSGPLGMIYGMKEDSQGNIWLGTKGDGVTKLTPAGGGFDFTRYRHNPADRYSLASDQVYSIEQDREGKMWFGLYGGGISMLANPETGRFVTPANGFPDYPRSLGDKVRYLHLAPDGMMMVATVEGLIVFDPGQKPEKTDFRVVQKVPGDIHSLGNNDIIHIMTDSKHRVWLSTFGGGLNLWKGFDEQGTPRFDVYSTEQGLYSNIVFAATEDLSGHIWLSTENGISRLDPEQRTVTNFSKYDGIPPAIFSEATALTTPEGKVLLGSLRNLYIVDPATLKPTVEKSALAFTNFEIDNHAVAVGERSPLQTSIVEAHNITLPYDYAVFRLEFASLNFRMQPKLSYSYLLDGFDKEWILAKDIRSASYSNVPAGKYTFRVRSLLDDGQQTGDEIAVGITILAPPWRTWWAYALYIVLAALVVWLILRTLYTMLSLRSQVGLEQKMTELKLRFFTNISHELRTPLTLILGGVEDIDRRESLSERGEYNISLARKNAKRMLSLINQLLDFRKIVDEKMELKVRRVDIIPIAQGILDDFKEMAAEKRIELLFAVTHKNLYVWVDRQRIESVIYNLLSNAFKFTPDGKRVELSVSQREGDDHFTIAVRDEGIGIPRDKMEVVFDRFVQMPGTEFSPVKGSGIGLALCKEITELHHGTIGVENNPAGGSVFTVRLPMGNAHFSMAQIDFTEGEGAYADRSEYLTVDSDGHNTKRLDRRPPEGAQKILLVEDNNELRTFIYNNLVELYEVSEAPDGIQALEKIAENAPDIIITDLMMPGMDGIELTNRIRNDFEISHIPIIMLTAKDETEVRTQAMKYGADGYITKPFSMELLLARIENLLTQRHNLFERFSSMRAKVVDLSPGEIVITDRDEEFIGNVMNWIDSNIENSELTIDRLASHIGMGRTTMYNKIKGLTGKSPVEIIKEYRVTKARMLLQSGQFTVSEAAYKVGFSDPGYFSKCFKEQYKTSPAEFLKGIRGK